MKYIKDYCIVPILLIYQLKTVCHCNCIFLEARQNSSALYTWYVFVPHTKKIIQHSGCGGVSGKLLIFETESQLCFYNHIRSKPDTLFYKQYINKSWHQHI